jgi:hypothetical protein
VVPAVALKLTQPTPSELLPRGFQGSRIGVGYDLLQVVPTLLRGHVPESLSTKTLVVIWSSSLK